MPRSRPSPVVIRSAQKPDLPALGRLGAALARAHHGWDPERFFLPEAGAEGYAWWLGKEMKNKKAVVLVAVRGKKVIGYAYGRIEPRDWNLLRDKCGVGVDLMVDPAERGQGAGTLLGKALLDALTAKGAPFIVLQAASKNAKAQKLFRRMGFRPTIVEMTLSVGARPKR
ncbi:MAG: GNAT family N-acetyltransferase [Myxococcales bacterium]